MTSARLTFTKDGDHTGARILARSGRVEIGAIFPPLGRTGTKWRWRMWVEVANAGGKQGEANTEIGARNALLSAWKDFLRAAGLQQIEESDQ